jgi:hypothetical protein
VHYPDPAGLGRSSGSLFPFCTEQQSREKGSEWLAGEMMSWRLVGLSHVRAETAHCVSTRSDEISLYGYVSSDLLSFLRCVVSFPFFSLDERQLLPARENRVDCHQQHGLQFLRQGVLIARPRSERRAKSPEWPSCWVRSCTTTCSSLARCFSSRPLCTSKAASTRSGTHGGARTAQVLSCRPRRRRRIPKPKVPLGRFPSIVRRARVFPAVSRRITHFRTSYDC